ncbi:MAG: carbohydrate ABC transporter permease [Caldilineaceae bacterium]|nr:carbohydrate ABC transporter permease [Caldilineaceae bacterium]
MPRVFKHLNHLVLYILLTAGAVLMVIPFLDMVSTSFESQSYVLETPLSLIPRAPTLKNFVSAWQSNHFSLFFQNSLVVAIVTTLLSVLVSAMLAYGLARFEFRGKNFVFYAMLLTMMIPSLMLIIPQFMLAKTLGLRNSLSGLILVYVSMNIPLSTFLLRGFFEQLPRELEEAVLIDGGGHFTIFFRIALPLSTPALATVSIFTFLAAWDEFTWALTAIDNPIKRTLPVAIATFQGEHLTEWGLVFAASLIAIVPVIIVFVSLQRYFVKGLTSGAVRG